MIKIFVIMICSLLITTSYAQTSRKEKKEARNKRVAALVKQNEEGLMVYKKHLVYSAFLNTDGYGAFLEKGIRQDRRKTSLLRLELTERKHIKEVKSAGGGIFGGTNTTVFAKLNNVYQLRMGYGYQYMIGSKGNKNGIEVSAVGVGGLTLGLLKPYFFDVEDFGGNRKRVTFNNGDTARYNVFGASGLSYGWKQMKVKPGLFLKAGLRFDYGRDNEKVNAIELGLFSEFFASKIPQVNLIKQKQLFFGAYLGILMGKRK
jgi:hypothetical protein